MKEHCGKLVRSILAVVTLGLGVQTQAGLIQADRDLPIDLWRGFEKHTVEGSEHKRVISQENSAIKFRNPEITADPALPAIIPNEPIFCLADSCTLPERPDRFPIEACQSPADCGFIPIGYPESRPTAQVGEPSPWPLFALSLILLLARRPISCNSC